MTHVMYQASPYTGGACRARGSRLGVGRLTVAVVGVSLKKLLCENGVTDKNTFAGSTNDIPIAHSAIITVRHECVCEQWQRKCNCLPTPSLSYGDEILPTQGHWPHLTLNGGV